MMEVVVTTGAIGRAKLHLSFYRPDALPVAQPTTSKQQEGHQNFIFENA